MNTTNTDWPTEKLIARCDAVNRCHAAANILFPQLVEAMGPFVGKPVETVQGALRAPVQKAIDALKLPHGIVPPYVQVFRSSSMYTLAWMVKTSTTTSRQSFYHDVTLHIGDLDGIMLAKLNTPYTFRTDFTPERVLELRKEYVAAKRVADVAREKLHPFGEYDN